MRKRLNIKRAEHYNAPDDYKSGWLSPTGEFIEAKYMEHLSLAADILEMLRPEEPLTAPDTLLLNMGWVSIGIATLFEHGWSIYWRSGHHLTYEQKKFLEPYFNNKTYLNVTMESLERWEEEGE